jgi:hypothetical protein
MASDMENIEFARNNENFAADILSEHSDQKNWVVTIRFYSYIHYVEERLESHDYTSNSHNDRKDNILQCRSVSDKAWRIYRALEDISRDARYECIKMTREDVERAEEKLEEGKEVLGFSNAGSDNDTKYSI